jgi:hypothetical protein
MKKIPDLRPATTQDIAKFTDGKMKMSCKAIVADLDGEIIGIGGIYYTKENVIVFSDFTEKMEEFPFTIARAVKLIMNIVGNKTCVAIADEKHPGSEKLLTRIGFRHLAGRIYGWQTH